MRKQSIGVLLVFLLCGALLSSGCSDDSTGPGGGTEPQSEELTHSWSARFGDAEEELVLDVAVDSYGNIVIAGSFWGTVDFGGGTLTSAGANDFFIAKFGPDGTHIWSKRFGDATLQELSYVAVDASGNVIITGNFYGSVDFGGGALTSAGSSDIYAAKFGPDGSHLWSKRFGGSGPQSGWDVSADASGNVLIAGRFYGTVDFGGGTLTSGGNDDIFVAKFDPDGTHLWSNRYGDASAQYATDMAVDGSGNVTISGYLSGSVDFGGGVLTSAGSIDIFVAKFDPSGAHMWSDRFGDSDYQLVIDIACDASGNNIITGHFEGTVNFGGGTLTSAGGTDAFVAAFDPSGTHLWSKRFGDATEQTASSVAADGSGNIILAGHFLGDIDCGGDLLTSAGSYDIFVARFGSSGAHLWSDSFGDASEESISGITANTAGAAIIIGHLYGSLDLGGGTLTSAGSRDIFIAKFEP